MSSGSEAAAGSIYDLGYRDYTGPRLGRQHAVTVLYFHSLRSAFGLGRRPGAKIIPIGLAILALVPAAIQLGIAAVVDDVEFIRPENHYAYIQTIIALFCAAVAPELLGRDQRNRTLSLYFSRAIARDDYVLAKLAALTTALLALTLVPQTLLLIGNGLASNDLDGYFADEWDLLPAIAATAVLISLLFGSIGLYVGSQSPRRAYTSGGVLAIFVLTFSVVNVLIAISDGIVSRLTVFLAPFLLARGFTLWLFDAAPDPESSVGKADFGGAIYAIVAIGFIALLLALTLRRYRRMAP